MRIVFDVILFLSLFIAPWWVSLALALVGVFAFARFYEIILAGIIMDVVYGAQSASFLGLQFISTAASVLIFWGGAYLKKQMLIYQ